VEGSDDFLDRIDGSIRDKNGTPISVRERWRLVESWEENVRVGLDVVGNYRISTVWLGYDHGFGGRPLIFETMVFDFSQPGMEKWKDLDCRRYETEEEAIEGHQEVVEEVKLIVEATDGMDTADL
jgi:hypothetical protein